MKFILSILRLCSFLPLGVLYVLSDTIYLLNYYVIGYRKKVVRNNIANSFPDKTKSEITKIEKDFFKNFCDYLVETAKGITISENELKVRVQHINQDLFHEAKRKNQNIIFLAGHVFNWEWLTALATILPQEKSFPVYRKISNPGWNEQIIEIRNRFKNESIEAGDVVKHILRNPSDGNSAYMFVADQSPHSAQVDVGLRFLSQETPVFIGYDKLATRLNLCFIYCEMKKVKRGFYQINYHQITPDNEKFQEFEVVKKFHTMLERTIMKDPGNYLWSHRRWKYNDLIKRRI